jgi:N-acetylneuraminic acid mutarotase
MANLSLGAENDSLFDIMRKHLSPALVGRGWDALLSALAVGDQYKNDLAKAAFEQLFKSTASGVYLDRLLSDDGVTRPPGIGIGDDPFRTLGIKTTARKLLIQVILEVLETYYGSEATRAYTTSGTAEPFALSDEDELFVEIDGQRTIRIAFDEASFTSIGAATAVEVATAITRTLRNFNSSAYAQAFQDPETGDSFVRIFSGALGLSGSLRILGGRGQNTLLFPSQVHTGTTTTGPEVGTEWNVTPGNGTNGIDSGRVRFTWSGGADPDLQEVYTNDYVNIYGSVFASSNRGAFKVLTGTTTYFEVENVSAVTQSGVIQLAVEDLIFFRPEKRTIQNTGRMATATQGTPGTLEVILPATTQIVQREENTGAYLHTHLHTTDVASGIRASTGVVTITTSTPHGLTAGRWFFADEITPDVGSANEYVDSGDPTSQYFGTTFNACAILHDGSVLVCGGDSTDGASQSNTYIYTPSTGLWVTQSQMTNGRTSHTATVMDDGRVIIVGGTGSSPALVEIFDPVTGTWSPGASPQEQYDLHSSVLLRDGRVMVLGQFESEIFNPATNTWSYAAAHSGYRTSTQAVVLDDGRVVLIGGNQIYAEVYNPTNDTWAQTSAYTNIDLTAMATIAYRGGVFLVGGKDDGSVRAMCKFLNPSTLVWEDRANLPTGRSYHDITLLSDGTILAVGGMDDDGIAVSVCSIYDPNTDAWKNKSDWTVDAQFWPHAIELESKNILVTGGTGSSQNPILSELLISKYSTTYATSTSSSGGLSGLFRVASVVSPTVFTFSTPEFLLPTTFSVGTISSFTALTNDVQGPFIYDPANGVAVTGIETITTIEIEEGGSYNTLAVVDASEFPDQEGWLCFGFGNSDQVQPVHYLGRISSTVLLLDPTYTFPKTLIVGTSVTLLKQRGPWTPSGPEEVGSFYVTAAASGRIAASDTIDEIVAAGVNIGKVVIYPSDKGLGNEGAPDARVPKLSDKVAVWGGDNLDAELTERRGE